jgi:hypothetical protein
MEDISHACALALAPRFPRERARAALTAIALAFCACSTFQA